MSPAVSARVPSSPRSSGKDKSLSGSGKEVQPAVTDKVQVKDMAFWRTGRRFAWIIQIFDSRPYLTHI